MIYFSWSAKEVSLVEDDSYGKRDTATLVLSSLADDVLWLASCLMFTGKRTIGPFPFLIQKCGVDVRNNNNNNNNKDIFI